VANKVFVNWDHKAKQEANKRMKTKVSLLAVALGKMDPTKQSALPWKGRPNGRAHFNKTNVPITKRLVTGRMNAPDARTNIRAYQDCFKKEDSMETQTRGLTSLAKQELSQTREDQAPYY
jgi:hypothetical protein